MFSCIYCCVISELTSNFFSSAISNSWIQNPKKIRYNKIVIYPIWIFLYQILPFNYKQLTVAYAIWWYWFIIWDKKKLSHWNRIESQEKMLMQLFNGIIKFPIPIKIKIQIQSDYLIVCLIVYFQLIGSKHRETLKCALCVFRYIRHKMPASLCQNCTKLQRPSIVRQIVVRGH